MPYYHRVSNHATRAAAWQAARARRAAGARGVRAVRPGTPGRPVDGATPPRWVVVELRFAPA
jgi:hypothetical protein